MSIHEECGVFGIYDPNGGCARTAYYGLYALQHRGQEAAGIATINDRELSYHKDLGLVGDVFDDETLERLNGTMAVGHVRYATTGGGRRENAQPLTLKYVKGTLAVAHNGNLVNAPQLRHELEYTGADGEKHRPIMIHRVVFGSIERFIGILIEHFAGAFPTWLAPVQVKILPISDKYADYSKEVLDKLTEAGIRAEMDTRSEKIGYKIREAQTQKIPYMLVVGQKEEEEKTVSVRSRFAGDEGASSVESFIESIQKEIEEKNLRETVKADEAK